MAQNYGQIKTMKTAKIGTIMPWAGNGNDGSLPSNIPKGWILCNGRVYQADRYPLLSSVLGNSYGGTDITGDFPEYGGTVKVPDITGRVMMDLEPAMLFDPEYQAGQADAYLKLVDAAGDDLVVDDGLTKSITTNISADTNISFSIPSDIEFSGKLRGGANETNITISNPSFTATVYTIGRKLGINHMPTHRHPGEYTTAVGGASGPELFYPSAFQVGGSQSGDAGCPDVSWLQASLSDPDAPRWCNGAGFITYYDDTTLIETFEFNEFISTPDYDYSQIPPETAPDVIYDGLSAYTDTFTAKPITTHAQVAWEGFFPRPMEFFGSRNFFGYGTGFVDPTGIPDDPEYRPAQSFDVLLQSGSTSFTIPAGTFIGTSFDYIRPFMLVKVDNEDYGSGAYLERGTQVISISREGSVGNYEYVVELSKNVVGAGTSTKTVTFRDGTYPTNLNRPPSGQDPTGQTFRAHDHGTFEIEMGGGLKGPTTVPVNNVSKGDVLAQTINGALNISAQVANPSQNIVYIIRAY